MGLKSKVFTRVEKKSISQEGRAIGTNAIRFFLVSLKNYLSSTVGGTPLINRIQYYVSYGYIISLSTTFVVSTLSKDYFSKSVMILKSILASYH